MCELKRNIRTKKEVSVDLKLEGKVAVVTGGAGGVGREIAIALAEENAAVIIADINEEEGERFAAELRERHLSAEFRTLNVTDSSSINSMCEYVLEKRGTIDILINSAGITDRRPALDFPEEVFDKIIAVNLKGTFLCCQAVGRVMAEKRKGKIVNISSIGGTIGLRNTVAYCASKGGVVQVTRALAVDWAQYNISVNAIAPGLNNTPIAKQVFQDKATFEWFLSKIPLGRLCEPREVANAALFLSSEVSDYITGHILAIDGGWTTE
jgi:NAD(P)-dependent dehydrogenase (short-subunit alcohol dehydrogenase family)